MPSVNIALPCAAYTGNEAFAFVSYAHADASLVYPEIRRLDQMGRRIWYDEGIDPGNEWPEEIANALNRASLFLVFVTQKAIGSRNVRNEINYALRIGKPFLAVHLLETVLPPGMDLQMSSLQAILKWRMDKASYLRSIDRAVTRLISGTPTGTPSSSGATGIGSALLSGKLSAQSLKDYCSSRFPSFTFDRDKYLDRLLRELERNNYEFIADIDSVVSKTEDARRRASSGKRGDDGVYQVRLALVLADSEYMWSCHSKPISLAEVKRFSFYGDDIRESDL